MVRILAFALLATTALAAITKRTVAAIEADLNTITTDVKKLDTDINAFPDTGGSLLAALAIHTDATTLESDLNKATNDTTATPGPLSETDAQTILGLVNTVSPIIQDALSKIVAKKPAFTALPIGGIPALILSDLKTLNNDTMAFEKALVAIAPADLIPTANMIISQINAAFASAIAAYS